ncbi:MAG: Asp-tRNA(Asn)/Glu-tRNA(Gln) amidotransferase subunit GatA [Verrucomicrobia bacterium]|nr:Asp-tRNA(Asn)/Glu-tRNA(Gln) amidotransferase subunit GatA [Verrucomicrobiota bacterium]MBU6446204.1 Asp-tRNA(Asn)/Glu-tRNA(Gln) amidotransferase subunit GatA [Verrucomicrobiota bacterium]MDE3047141.1 Asp-tRNA(Asn)/Glu-tRNA(Gln) amidotransferase subunit GatA [Verrucomicrobiota bacterium]
MHRLSAIEIRDLFCKGEVSAVQIAEHFLNRIEAHNEELGTFLSVLRPRVLRKAESLDKRRSRKEPVGKLAGVPIAIKDNMHIAHEITTCGSKFLSNYKAPFSATAVHLLEEADALILGKTNMDEFAMGSSNENSAYWKVQNPWNHKCVPGGSSGGSAAAVAARLSLIATGSDTGGSIRQPASFCGLVGYKPTYGRVSRFGLVAFASSLDQIGPMTTTVADAALAMEVMGQHCPRDATSLDLPPEAYPLSKELAAGTVIGIPWSFLENLTPEARKNFDAAVQVMRDLGAKIVDINLDLLKYSIATYYILATAEASTNLARFDGIRFGMRSKEAKTLEEIYELSRKEGFGCEVKRRIMLGTYVLSAGFQDAFYKKAQKVRTLILDAFESIFNHCDAVMTPVTTSGAFEHGAFQDPVQMYLQDIFTVPANLAGIPGISIPSGYDSRGMPLGVQILGPQMCDVALMQISYAYEQATKHARIPGDYE